MSELVSKWGVPQHQMTLPDGTLIYEYLEQAPSTYYRYGATTSEIPGNSCRTTFKVDKAGQVTGFSYKNC